MLDFADTAIVPEETKNRANAANTLVLMHWKSLRMDFVLQGLAEHLQGTRVEFWKFIQKQHTAMRQRDLTRMRPPPTRPACEIV